jgi:hypothetical protein
MFFYLLFNFILRSKFFFIHHVSNQTSSDLKYYLPKYPFSLTVIIIGIKARDGVRYITFKLRIRRSKSEVTSVLFQQGVGM